MPAPRWLGRFNRRVTNRLLGRLAPWLPGFGVITHTGRKSGREYRTPVNVFVREGGYIVALTYGRESEWVRNVLASGGCELTTRGRSFHLTDPHLVHDEQRRAVPVPVRVILGIMNVTDFLALTLDDGIPASGRGVTVLGLARRRSPRESGSAHPLRHPAWETRLEVDNVDPVGTDGDSCLLVAHRPHPLGPATALFGAKVARERRKALGRDAIDGCDRRLASE